MWILFEIAEDTNTFTAPIPSEFPRDQLAL